MVSYSGSFPTIVYKQPTEPSVESGALWFNTIDNKMYYCDGLSYSLLSINTDFITEIVGQNALNILDLTAQASLTAGTNAYFIRDTYKDANGYLNSIDIANTTAIFDTNKYKNFNNSNSFSVNNTGNMSQSGSWGIWFLTKNGTGDLYIKSLETKPATNLYLKNSAGDILASGLDDIYSYKLSQNTKYRLEMSSAGSWTIYERSGGYTIDSNFIDSTGLSNNGADSTYGSFTSAQIQSFILDFDNKNKIITTNKQDLSFKPSYFMIVSNFDITDSGESLFDISFNNGTNYIENVNSYNTYEITYKGQELILINKLNNNSVTSYNYGVLIW